MIQPLHLFFFRFFSLIFFFFQVAQSCPTLCDPLDCTHQAPLSMRFSRQEHVQNTEYRSLCCTVGPSWHLFYTWQCVCVNPKLLVCPSPPFPSGDCKFVFCVCGSTTFLNINSFVSFFFFFLDSTHK